MVQKLAVANELLTYENQGLREAITVEKKKRKRGKPLMSILREGDVGTGMFFSPKKIQKARDLHAQSEAEKAREKVEKEAKKLQKEKEKVEKRRLLEERKEIRLQARLQRLQEKEAKSQEKQAKKVALALEKQLKDDSKRAQEREGKGKKVINYQEQANQAVVTNNSNISIEEALF
jgi:hypothetical protein